MAGRIQERGEQMTKQEAEAIIVQSVIDGAKEVGIIIHLEGVNMGEFDNSGGRYTAYHFTGQADTPDEYMVLKIRKD
jgi:hypothetical protein